MKQFLSRAFSEQDGTPSFARIGSGILLGFACGWITAVVHFTHAIPDVGTLGGLGALIGTPYAINRFNAGKD